MDYIGSHQPINWLFILACLSVLQWLITLYFVYHRFDILGKEIPDNAFAKKSKLSAKSYDSENRIPFTRDYFYIYWNIYPIIFYLFFYYLDTSWKAYLDQIVMIGGKEAQTIYNSFFKTFDFFGLNISYLWIDMFVIFVGTLIAYKSTFGTQITKQEQYIEEPDKLYWWDIRICKKLFWIRFIFLFYNMILVSFIAYIGFKSVFFITGILSIETLEINPFHPDTFGGLKVLMEIASIILAIYLLRGMMGVIGLIDHKYVKDKFQLIGDIYHTAYLFFGVTFIAYFIYKVDYILGKVDIGALLNNDIYNKFHCNMNENSNQIIQLSNEIANYYTTLLKFNKFPIDLALFSSSIFTFVLPLIIWFAISFVENRTKDITKKEDAENE